MNTPTSPVEKLRPHAKWLRKAAEEIRSEGHTGWGNTCEQAAEALEATLSQPGMAEDDATVERVAKAICETEGYEDDWEKPTMFMTEATDTAESCREIYRDMARAAIRALSASPHASGAE